MCQRHSLLARACGDAVRGVSGQYSQNRPVQFCDDEFVFWSWLKLPLGSCRPRGGRLRLLCLNGPFVDMVSVPLCPPSCVSWDSLHDHTHTIKFTTRKHTHTPPEAIAVDIEDCWQCDVGYEAGDAHVQPPVRLFSTVNNPLISSALPTLLTSCESPLRDSIG